MANICRSHDKGANRLAQNRRQLAPVPKISYAYQSTDESRFSKMLPLENRWVLLLRFTLPSSGNISCFCSTLALEPMNAQEYGFLSPSDRLCLLGKDCDVLALSSFDSFFGAPSTTEQERFLFRPSLLTPFVTFRLAVCPTAPFLSFCTEWAIVFEGLWKISWGS